MRTFAIAACAALFFGCSQPATTDNENTDPAESVAVTPVNSHCPIMGGAVSEEGGTVQWNGKTIGFCCDGCDEKWEKLSDEEKAAKLAEATAGEHEEEHADHGEHDHS